MRCLCESTGAEDVPGEALPSALDRLDHTRFPTSPSSAEEPELRALASKRVCQSVRARAGVCVCVCVLPTAHGRPASGDDAEVAAPAAMPTVLQLNR